VVRRSVLIESGRNFGNSNFTEELEEEMQNDSKRYKKLIKSNLDLIRKHFNKKHKLIYKKTKEDLTYANYFKSNVYMVDLLK
jgi:hypothetical protein